MAWTKQVRPGEMGKTANSLLSERMTVATQKDTEGAVGTQEKGDNNEFIDNFSKFNIPGPTPPPEFRFLMPGTVDYFVASHLSKPPFLFPLVCTA